MIARNGSHVILTLAVVAIANLALAPAAQADWIAYHDLGATTGQESTGNITTHQSGGSGSSANTLDTTAKDLIKYSDGTDTGVDFSIAGANGMDSRNPNYTLPPAASTPADPLFNVTGLNLNNGLIYEGGGGGSGFTTFTFSGLDANLLYDVALYGDRNLTTDGAERFTLGGADSATNSSSTGIVGPGEFITDMETRPNAATGNVVHWTAIDPGADGIITIDIDPEFNNNLSNIAYLSAVRLEATPEPATMSLLVLGGLAMLRRRRRS